MSEKRYFKIFSERHTIGEQNKYVALFDLIDKYEVEDDVVLKEQLKKQGINGDFISADKNYLYRLVLKSLNDFHSSKTLNLEIKESLISIEILFKKGLYKECYKLIIKTEELAEISENYQLMIDILMWKKKCYGYSLGLNKAAEVNKIMDKYISLLNNVKVFTDLYYESNLIQANNEKYSKQDVVARFKQIMQNPLLKSEKMALTNTSKIYFYLIQSNFFYTQDNKQKELENLEALVKIIDSFPSYSQENPLDYVSIYNRLLSVKKYFPQSNFFDDINKLNEFPKDVKIRTDVVLQRVFVHTNTHELEYYLINNDFEKALNKIKEVDKDINVAFRDIEPYHVIYFYYLHTIILIFVGQFNKALKFCNNILNDFDALDRPQVFIRVEVLNAIIHFELGNFSLVTSLAKQILKKNTQRQVLIDVEESILKALIKVASFKLFTVKEEVAVWNSVLDLVEKKKAELKHADTLLDNYEKWLISKVKRKIVSDIL